MGDIGETMEMRAFAVIFAVMAFILSGCSPLSLAGGYEKEVIIQEHSFLLEGCCSADYSNQGGSVADKYHRDVVTKLTLQDVDLREVKELNLYSSFFADSTKPEYGSAGVSVFVGKSSVALISTSPFDTPVSRRDDADLSLAYDKESMKVVISSNRGGVKFLDVSSVEGPLRLTMVFFATSINDVAVSRAQWQPSAIEVVYPLSEPEIVSDTIEGELPSPVALEESAEESAQPTVAKEVVIENLLATIISVLAMLFIGLFSWLWVKRR